MCRSNTRRGIRRSIRIPRTPENPDENRALARASVPEWHVKIIGPCSFVLFTVACHAASLTGSGSFTNYFCYETYPVFRPVDAETHVSGPVASFPAGCPVGSTTSSGSPFAYASYSASYSSLSMHWNILYDFIGSLSATAGFSDQVTVTGPESGFLVLNGNSSVGGFSETAATISYRLTLGDSSVGDGCPPGHRTMPCSSTKAFTLYVPFIAGTPVSSQEPFKRRLRESIPRGRGHP